MSREIDEAELALDVFQTIRDTGRLGTFTVSGTDHEWWISPPRTVEDMPSTSNEEEEFLEFLVPALNIQFTPDRVMKFTDTNLTGYIYRIVRVQPIDSGSQITAYKMRVAR